MKSRITEHELVERLGELPREISPNRDPWPEISARIESPSPAEVSRASSSGWMLKAVAASVLLAFTVGLLLGPLRNDQPSGAVDTVALEKTGLPAESFRLQGALIASESEYQAAFREFIPIGESRKSLPLKTVEMIESGWADLTDTETVLTAALEQNPEDQFLSGRMLELRARQLGFLKQLARLDRNSRRMTI
ncbi:MAG: hypothetical protein GWP58_07885 [Gammaproteobacteria bacterium]|jgi:hypothetical protein|nr:hypothetical protein [Gammaproteobacteria bacterium]